MVPDVLPFLRVIESGYAGAAGERWTHSEDTRYVWCCIRNVNASFA